MNKLMNKLILIIIILIVLGVISLIFIKKCVTYFDPVTGKQAGGCYYIWQKGWWEPSGKIISTNDNNKQKNNNIPNHVKIGEEKPFIQTPALRIKLLDVSDDGRCPADVECFHSGWATVLAEASYNGVREKKELHIRGGNSNVFMGPEEASNKLGSGNVISIDQFKVFLVALNPYPVTTKKFEKTS